MDDKKSNHGAELPVTTKPTPEMLVELSGGKGGEIDEQQPVG
jgi:hypothetical protein